MAIASKSRAKKRSRSSGDSSRASAADATKLDSSASARPWLPAAIWFTLGLLCRLPIFTAPHAEGDEILYRELVRQLDAGHGYTLRGTALVGHGWPADQYGQALFFHPPGGIGLFWLLHRVLGEPGYSVAQLLCFALFFWSAIAMAKALLVPFRGLRVHAVAALAAFTPIMANVAAHHWLDLPMLAFATLAGALFLAGVERRRAGLVLLAALAMGYASWVKTAALVTVPALLVLAWAAADDRGRAVRLGLLFALVCVLLQSPWQLWQWRVVGSPFPAWAGRPSPELVATNQYVYALTVLRPPWLYLTLTPRVVWTLIPSLAGLAAPGMDARTRRVAWALVVWIAMVLTLVIGLGAIGYSKLMRYAIMITPATVLLFGLVAGEVRARLSDPKLPPAERTRTRVLAAIAAAGFALEIAQGLFVSLARYDRDIITPIIWRGTGFY